MKKITVWFAGSKMTDGRTDGQTDGESFVANRFPPFGKGSNQFELLTVIIIQIRIVVLFVTS